MKQRLIFDIKALLEREKDATRCIICSCQLLENEIRICQNCIDLESKDIEEQTSLFGESKLGLSIVFGILQLGSYYSSIISIGGSLLLSEAFKEGLKNLALEKTLSFGQTGLFSFSNYSYLFSL